MAQSTLWSLVIYAGLSSSARLRISAKFYLVAMLFVIFDLAVAF